MCVSVCFIWRGSGSQKTGSHCAAGSNEGGNEGLGFQIYSLQVHHYLAQDSQGTEGAEEGEWISMKITELFLDNI